MMMPSAVRALADILAGASAVLLDFDGPICDIFAGGTNRAIANRLRTVLADAGVEPTSSIEHTFDPLEVLRFSGHLHRPELLDTVEQAIRAAEVDAAHETEPTTGAAEAIRACHTSGRQLAIISNNSTDAIKVYLEKHQLSDYVDHVAGRPYAAPYLMKPHPNTLNRALHTLGVQPGASVLVGDSITDVEAARAAGAFAVGYAKRPERRPQLTDAEADAIIDSMTELAPGLRASGPLLPS